ncbi:hypothetical protein Tco_0448058 [Tanacetum coccineum]
MSMSSSDLSKKKGHFLRVYLSSRVRGVSRQKLSRSKIEEKLSCFEEDSSSLYELVKIIVGSNSDLKISMGISRVTTVTE